MNDPENLIRSSFASLQAGDRLRALAICRSAVATSPGHPDAALLQGVLLLEDGRPADAAAWFRRRLAAASAHLDPVLNLGVALQSLGDIVGAATLYRRSIALAPDMGVALANLAAACRSLDLSRHSVDWNVRALAVNPADATTHGALGRSLASLGRMEEALAAFRRAAERDPSNRAWTRSIAAVVPSVVPGWHFPMVNDVPRNVAYDQAIRDAVRSGDHVLEIGAGSGLLAMSAARAGAAAVTTCELVRPVANIAQRIVAANGYADRVRVVARPSFKLEVGSDLPKRADVLAFEILSSRVLGEGVLDALEDAKQRLLRPGARVVPERVFADGMLIESEDIELQVRVGDALGFDLSIFNEVTPPLLFIARNDYRWTSLSDPIELAGFDLQNDATFPEASWRRMVRATRDGRCCGVLQWIRIDFDGRNRYDNGPERTMPASGWQQVLHVFPSPLHVKAGQIVDLTVAHDRRQLWVERT